MPFFLSGHQIYKVFAAIDTPLYNNAMLKPKKNQKNEISSQQYS